MTKKKLRNVYRKCRDKENVAIAQRIPTAVVCEDESIRSYNRKRLIQNYETPPAKRRATNKSHSPDFENVIWNKDEVLEALEARPSCSTFYQLATVCQKSQYPRRSSCQRICQEVWQMVDNAKECEKGGSTEVSTYLTYSNHSLEGHGRQRPIVSWCTLLSFPLCC